jgi:DNA-binding CsgD family transcriptional regulator
MNPDSYFPSFICPILIGRSGLLRRLDLVARQVQNGKGQGILLGGEAGIGKSRLVAELKKSADLQNFLILEGFCFQTDQILPYAPWLDLFHAYFARLAPPLPENLQALAVALSNLLPELALLFPELAGLPPTFISLEPEEEKRRTFAAMLHFLLGQAAQRPLLIVLEDIHWADDLSLEFLLYLARHSRNRRVFLLMTFRNDESNSRLQQWLAQLDRERLAEELLLTNLSKSEVAAMLQVITGKNQPAEVSLLNTIYERSDGNPFYVEELLKTLFSGLRPGGGEEGKQNSTGPTPIPRSVFEVVQQRTATLSDDARQLLTLAAVTGRRFNTTLLQAVLNWEETQLLALLKELIATQLVVEETSERFAFRHALTQEAIVAKLLLREQQTLHHLIAETLQEFAKSPVMRKRYLEDLAYHSFEAGMWEQATLYSKELGEKALKMYAQQTAIDYLSRAVTAAQQLDQPPRAELYLSRGKAYETLGDFEQARNDYEQAGKIAGAAHQYRLEWESRLAIGFLWTGYDYERAGEWFQKALALSEQSGDRNLRAWSLGRLGNWYLNKGQIQQAINCLEEAYRNFEILNEKQGMAETLEQLGAAYFFLGNPARGINEYFTPVIGLFRAMGNQQSLFYTLAARSLDSSPENLETTLSSLRNKAECLQDLEEALKLARQINTQSGLAFVEMCYSQVFSSFGEFGQALDHVREALEIAGAIEHQEWIAASNGVLGEIYLLLLDGERAVAYLERAIAGAETLGSMIWKKQLWPYLASAYLLRQEVGRAEVLLRKATPTEQPPLDYFERQAARVGGHLALAQAKPALALEIAEMLLETVPGKEEPQSIPHLLALKGEALLALGRLKEAALTLEEAKRGAEQRQALSINWRIRALLGRAYNLLKDENKAQQEWSEGREIIKRLAAPISDPTLRDNFLQAALRGFPAEKTALPAAAASLTTREREVAALVAAGKTNREIADSLFVSERTAEAHVSNILGKLGFSTRAQIAVWVVGKGLVSH